MQDTIDCNKINKIREERMQLHKKKLEKKEDDDERRKKKIPL